MSAGENGTEKKQAGKKHGWWRPVALLCVVIAIMIAAAVFDLGEYLKKIRTWIESLGPWGPVAFIGLYAVATVAALPGSALTAGAGILFGSTMGVICASIASTLGAGLAFLVARYFARQSVEGWLADNNKFRKLDEMTGRHGAIIVAITRLVPIFPFNLLNYGFGLTQVRFWTYVLCSWLCMLPGTVLYVVGADAITSGIAKGEVPWGLLGVLAAVIVVLVFLVKMAKKRLEDDGGDTAAEDELPVEEVSST